MMLGPEHGLVLMTKLDTNALSPPDDIYCLLRVPTTYPLPLDFAGLSKRYLRHRAVGYFTTADSFAAATLYLSTTTSCPKIGSGGGFTFHISSNNFLQRALCVKSRGFEPGAQSKDCTRECAICTASDEHHDGISSHVCRGSIAERAKTWNDVGGSKSR
jgi:hypothetical protein